MCPCCSAKMQTGVSVRHPQRGTRLFKTRGTRLRIKLYLPSKSMWNMHMFVSAVPCFTTQTSPPENVAIYLCRSRCSVSGRLAACDWSVKQNKTYTQLTLFMLQMHIRSMTYRASISRVISDKVCDFLGNPEGWFSPQRYMIYATV